MRSQALAAQTAAEARLTLKRGETLLVTLGIPVMLLVFFSLVHVLPTGTGHPVDFLAPSVLALAVLSTAMVSLGIATGFERSYGVLKRLGTTPLGRGSLVAAKILAVLAVEVVQVVVLVAIAFALGWRPHAGAPLAVGVELLGTVAFAGLGLLMAGGAESGADARRRQRCLRRAASRRGDRVPVVQVGGAHSGRPPPSRRRPLRRAARRPRQWSARASGGLAGAGSLGGGGARGGGGDVPLGVSPPAQWKRTTTSTSMAAKRIVTYVIE